MIPILSRVLHDVVKGLLGPRGFVGHIGGDDFIFIIPASDISLVCTEILSVFDTLVPFQYNEQDQRAGYFFGKDRRGQLHRGAADDALDLGSSPTATARSPTRPRSASWRPR
ncbi:MAG: hypothetical protein R2909_00730 [Gemmatimonadales bacterium]